MKKRTKRIVARVVAVILGPLGYVGVLGIFGVFSSVYAGAAIFGVMYFTSGPLLVILADVVAIAVIWLIYTLVAYHSWVGAREMGTLPFWATAALLCLVILHAGGLLVPAEFVPAAFTYGSAAIAIWVLLVALIIEVQPRRLL